MDCDDVMLLLAGDDRTLTDQEGVSLKDHLSSCDGCRQVATERSSRSLVTRPDRQPATPPPGSRIGRFVVVEALGAGAMGAVVAAYDPDLDRKIAIKLLRADAARSSTGRERLTREARAMARLSHDNVLTVHEVGTVGEQVFIAMEFAAGGTLRDWMVDGPRPWREVLDRFLQAGRGLAAAHRAGLVHRDFKPENVVLTRDGRVRVADFGLAGVAAAELELPPGDPVASSHAPIHVSLTVTGSLLGTPAYMAPEQHRMEVVDARADQFAFCVALYEALYGERPFGGESYLELLLQLRERELREPPAGSAVPRRIYDVVVRGLADDPRARFPSMDALLAALADDPAARRRRILLGAAAGCLVASLAVMALSRGGRAEAPCERAAEGLAGVWDDARRDALQSVLGASPRRYAGDAAARVIRGLDDHAAAWAAERVAACEATHVRGEQSSVALDLRMRCLDRRRAELAALVTVLSTEPGPDLVEHAVQAVHRLIPTTTCADVEALAAAMPPPEDPGVRARVEAARARLDRAEALERAGKYDEGLSQARGLADEARALGYAPLRAEAVALVARLLEATGKFQESEAAHHEVLVAAAEAKHDDLVAESWRRLIEVVGVHQSRHDVALGMRTAAQTAVIRARATPRLEADLAQALGALAWIRADHQAARDHYARALALRERHQGGDELTIAATLTGLGPVLRAMGRHDEARDHYQRALAIYERVLGPEHPEVARPLDNLGVVLNAQGKHAEAERLHLRALAIKQHALGEDHPRLANTLNNLGLVFKATGRYAEAEARYRQALAIFERSLGPAHPRLASALNNLGFVLRQQGRLDEAAAHYERALAIDRKALGPEHPYVADTLNNLGLVLHAQRRYEQAQDHLERALAIKERALGPAHHGVANTLNNLGNTVAARGRRDEAQRHHERALALWEAALDPDHPSLAFALTSLGEVLVGRGRAGDAVEILERALAIRERHDVARELLAETRAALARALWRAARDRDRAIALARQARDGYAAGGDFWRPALADLDAWLRRVRPPAAP